MPASNTNDVAINTEALRRALEKRNLDLSSASRACRKGTSYLSNVLRKGKISGSVAELLMFKFNIPESEYVLNTTAPQSEQRTDIPVRDTVMQLLNNEEVRRTLISIISQGVKDGFNGA